MNTKPIKIQVFRQDPASGEPPFLQTYEVAATEGMSVLQALDYVYEKVDSSLAYYHHAACAQGICGQCAILINGKTQWMCQTPVEDGMVLSVREQYKVVKDLVYTRGDH